MPQDHSSLPAVIPSNGVDIYRMSTDAAHICGAIVKQTAQNIQGKNYVRVEGWQAIAIAHGCAATSCNVERIDGGVRAIGQVRRMDNGTVIAEAEGFVGEDEPVWFGGTDKRGKKHDKRSDFAIRAMAQTRAISRACRSAFAHVVVMIDKSLSTTPAEEMQGVYENGSGVDGPGSSWGPRGKEGAIDDAEADGLMKNAPKVTGAKRAQFERWTTNAIGTIGLAGQTTESIGALWGEWSVKVDTLEEYAPDLHKQVTKAYNDAIDTLQARTSDTLQAG